MVRRVLVTRPEPGAGRTAKRLAGLGLDPVLLPLSETAALPVAPEMLPGGAAAVAITSANALRHASAELLAALSVLPCFAVGRKTADAARAAGFQSVEEGSGDAVALADRIAARLSGEMLIYLCGRVRMPGFEQKLGAANVDVRPVETYDTLAIDPSDDLVMAVFSTQPVNAALLYSVKAAEALKALMRRPALKDLFRYTSFFCLSQRIADELVPMPENRLYVAPEATEDALLGLLAATR